MLLAVHRNLAALNTVVRVSREGGMEATPGDSIQHAVLSMHLAIDTRLAALGGKARQGRGRVVQATFTVDVDHAILSIYLHYIAALPPLTLYLGNIVQESCQQDLAQKRILPASSCYLRYLAVMLPSA